MLCYNIQMMSTSFSFAALPMSLRLAGAAALAALAWVLIALVIA